jgi:hypothetical protein
VTGQVVRVEGEIRHRVDHGKEAIDALRWMKSLGVSRDKLVEYFGHSGLGRYEAQLNAEDEKSGKLIEGRVEAPGLVSEFHSQGRM